MLNNAPTHAFGSFSHDPTITLATKLLIPSNIYSLNVLKIV